MDRTTGQGGVRHGLHTQSYQARSSPIAGSVFDWPGLDGPGWSASSVDYTNALTIKSLFVFRVRSNWFSVAFLSNPTTHNFQSSPTPLLLYTFHRQLRLARRVCTTQKVRLAVIWGRPDHSVPPIPHEVAHPPHPVRHSVHIDFRSCLHYCFGFMCILFENTFFLSSSFCNLG